MKKEVCVVHLVITLISSLARSAAYSTTYLLFVSFFFPPSFLGFLLDEPTFFFSPSFLGLTLDEPVFFSSPARLRFENRFVFLSPSFPERVERPVAANLMDRSFCSSHLSLHD